MPSRQEPFSIRFQVANNIAEFVRRIARVQGDHQVVQPELGFLVPGAHMEPMDMGRLVASWE
jgi:hypothetical protein